MLTLIKKAASFISAKKILITILVIYLGNWIISPEMEYIVMAQGRQFAFFHNQLINYPPPYQFYTDTFSTSKYQELRGSFFKERLSPYIEVPIQLKIFTVSQLKAIKVLPQKVFKGYGSVHFFEFETFTTVTYVKTIGQKRHWFTKPRKIIDWFKEKY